MKIYCVVALCLLCVATGTRAQSANQINAPASIPADTAFHIVERGANHRVWQRETYEMGPSGKVITHVHKYTELSTGLHVKDSQGQWVESQELIESFQNGAIARRGRHQVAFANNLNTQGAVAVQMPDQQQQLVINVLGLAYHDNSTGSNVLIAQIQDSTGEMISSNQVLYLNAFNGINADVRYTYRRSGFEQDIILREQPVDPASLGLNPDTTELEVMTEFINPPAETIVDHSTRKHPSPDQDISWGSMFIGHGKAFDLGDQKPYWSGESVFKQYLTTEDGRKILVEIVPWKKVNARLSNLPKQASVQSNHPFMLARALPLPKTPHAKKADSPMKLASLSPSNKGYVLDYNLLDADTNNFTFQSDTTYLINGGVNFNGTTTFEGGTCIKYSATNGSVLQLWGPAICKSSEFRPIVMTSQNDNSVGEYIANSGPLFVLNEFSMNSGTNDVVMEHLRCSYADVGVHPTCPTFRLTDAQFINCGRPICPEYVDCQLNNVLMAGTTTNVFWGGEYTVEASHFTVDGCRQFTAGWDDSSDDNISFTNSLLIGINSFGYATITTNYTVQLASDAGVFQTVGGGEYYLATNSPYRGCGTTNIDPGFLSDIAGKTTYPPVVYSNLTFSVATNFGPAVPRDTNSMPDIGYHYDPLDYAFGGVNVYSNLTFTAGTAVGWFQLPGSGGTGYGLTIYDKVVLAFTGTASAPCVMAKSETVQEGGNGLWTDKGYMAGVVTASLSGGYGMSPTNAAMTMADFTHFFVMAADPNLFRESSALSQVYAQNSEFYGGGIGTYWDNLGCTNCLFDRTGMGVGGSNPAQWWMRNCTMHGGTLSLSEYGQTWPVWIEDCAFDGTSLSVENNSGGNTNETYCDFNAFVTNDGSVSAPGTHNVYVTNFNWETSWFGHFYLPINPPLINAGSTTADQFGLYHFTTQTNQVPETNSIVDIGYHYVATDQYGNPLDSNGNGIPDYIEDANGNGIYDVGDLAAWNVVADMTIPSAWYSANGLPTSSPLVGIQDPDWDGLLNQQEYLYGTRPTVSEGFSIWVGLVNGTTAIP